MRGHLLRQRSTGGAPVGPQPPQRHLRHDGLRQRADAPRVLPGGRGDAPPPEQAEGVGQHVARAALRLRAAIGAARPPLRVVGTDWRSTTPALGTAAHPWRRRSARRRVALSRSQVPSRCQRRTDAYPVIHVGRSTGNARHWQPVVST